MVLARSPWVGSHATRTDVRVAWDDGFVAGGMSRRPRWGAMAERVRQTQVHAVTHPPQAEPQVAAPTAAGSDRPPEVKHCWVITSCGPLPGLLLGWRHDEELGWLGRVVRPVRDEHGWLVMEDWLLAAQLRPASGDAPNG